MPTPIYKKNIYREMATKAYDGEPSKGAIMMPSTNAFCVQEAFKSGLFNQETKITLVERDKSTLTKASNKVKKLTPFFSKFEGELTDLDIWSVSNVDYAFFDLCSSFNKNIFNWMNNPSFRDMFSDYRSGSICFTFCSQVRIKKFISKFEKFFRNGNYLTHDIKRIMEANSNWINDLFFDPATNPATSYSTRLATIYAVMSLLDHHFTGVKLIENHTYRNGSKALQMMFLKFTYLGKKYTQNPKYTLHGDHYISEYGVQKTNRIKKTKTIGRPEGMSPQTWAWHPDNPKGQNKRRTKTKAF